MKLFVGFTLTVITLLNCNSAKTTGNTMNQDKTVVGKSSVQRISLSERTRGTNRLFTITPNKVESDMNGNVTSKNLSSDSWRIISDKSAQINLNEIQSYKSPTTKRYSDAALASVISIEKNGKTYSSSDFDSGMPPQQLADLYKEIKNVTGIKKDGN